MTQELPWEKLSPVQDPVTSETCTHITQPSSQKFASSDAPSPCFMAQRKEKLEQGHTALLEHGQPSAQTLSHRGMKSTMCWYMELGQFPHASTHPDIP